MKLRDTATKADARKDLNYAKSQNRVRGQHIGSNSQPNDVVIFHEINGNDQWIS